MKEPSPASLIGSERLPIDDERGGWMVGRHALITGASSGIGRQIALSLMGICSRLTLVSRDRHRGLVAIKSLLEAVNDTGDRDADVRRTDVEDCALDVRDTAGAVRLINRLYDVEGGQVDAFVNCAGGTHVYGRLETVTHDDIDSVFDVNARAPIHWLRELLPRMKTNRYSDATKKRAHVVMMSSRSGERALPNLTVYTAAKGSIEKLVDAVRTEYAACRIVFTVVNPGAVRTAFTQEWPCHARESHHVASMDVKSATRPIVEALQCHDAINRISYESVEQWLREPGVLT
jgi:NAD(P)-dependent dehydrogenase (short-subunit alcohol dehydrogenase family)